MSAPVIVLTGPPGSGKTTTAQLVADSYPRSAVVAGDSFFRFLRSGRIPPWEPDSAEQNDAVISITVGAAAGYAHAGWTTVLEGILGPWFLPTIRANSAGSTLHYIVLDAPLATCVRRFARREPRASTEVVEKMHREFARAEVDERHIVPAEADQDTVAMAVRRRIEQRTAQLDTA